MDTASSNPKFNWDSADLVGEWKAFRQHVEFFCGMSGEDCWLLSDTSDGMEQPASLFLFQYSILCPRLLLVSHEALLTIHFFFSLFFLTFLLFNQEHRSMLITIHVVRRHTHNYFSLIHKWRISSFRTFNRWVQVAWCGFCSIKNKRNLSFRTLTHYIKSTGLGKQIIFHSGWSLSESAVNPSEPWLL